MHDRKRCTLNIYGCTRVGVLATFHLQKQMGLRWLCAGPVSPLLCSTPAPWLVVSWRVAKELQPQLTLNHPPWSHRVCFFLHLNCWSYRARAFPGVSLSAPPIGSTYASMSWRLSGSCFKYTLMYTWNTDVCCGDSARGGGGSSHRGSSWRSCSSLGRSHAGCASWQVEGWEGWSLASSAWLVNDQLSEDSLVLTSLNFARSD